MPRPLRVKITADDSGFKPVVANAKRDLSQLGRAGGTAGGDISAGMTKGATQIKSIGDELSAVSGNISSGNAVAVASVGSLSHAVIEYSGGVFEAVKQTREMKAAADAASAASLAHHQQLSKQFSAVVAAGNGSTEYARSLRNQISQSTQAVAANKAHAASLNPLKSGLAALGGPVGLVATAATAMGLWFLSSKDATAETKNQSAANKELGKTFEDLTVNTLAARIVQAQDSLSKITGEALGSEGAKAFFQKDIDTLEARIKQIQQAEQRIRDVLNNISNKNKETGGGGGSGGGKTPKEYAFDSAVEEFRGREQAIAGLESALLNEEQRLGESYARRVEIAENNLDDEVALTDLKLRLQEDYFAKIEALEEKRSQKQAERITQEMQLAQEWADVWTSAGNRFAAGVGDAVADVYLQQENFADSAKNLAKSLARQVISSLTEIAVKQAAIHLLGLGQQATSTVATVASNAAIAKSAAPAAAGVSLATAGANSIPAASGISATYALTSGLSVIGQAHDGLEYVPKTGTYILERGERVVKQSDNQKLTRAINGGGGVTVVQNFSLSAIDGQSTIAFVKKNLPLFESVGVSGVQKAMIKQGRRGPLG